MKVLMHCVYFPPEVGGLESHIHHLCRGLVTRGCRVGVVTSRSRPELPRHETVDGIDVWRTPLPARNTPGWALHALGSLPRFAALAREADILHAQDIAAVLPCMTVRGAGNRAPFVTTYHTSHFLKRAPSPFWRPIFRHFLDAAAYNLAASREIAAVARAIAPDAPVEALTNGVDTSVFRPVQPSLPPLSHGRARLIVPRRLFPKNGVEYFVRAMPLIVRDVDAEAVIVGEGPERARLEAIASELGVGDRVTFLGACPHDDMPGILSGSTVAVFPSLMEATSVAALEAMACGVPVAASDVGGLPEIVDTSVGALFPAADPGALADTVVKLLRDSHLNELGRTARKRVVERWSNDRLVERHIEVYTDVIQRNAGRGAERG